MSEWQLEDLDLDAYLARIGHARVEPSAAALRSLHEAHVRSIPFENLDVLLGPHPGLRLKVIADKLVHRRRGGYCYEHGLLFAAALELLGFDVRRRMARVQPDKNGPRTHMVVLVRVAGIDHLADVGFGTGLVTPMPLVDGHEQDQNGWPHRITREGPLWILWRREPEGWTRLHATDDLPQHQIDYDVSNHYIATNPKSPFSGQLVAMTRGDHLSTRLVGDTLTTEHAGGDQTKRTITPGDLHKTLQSLGIDLPEDQVTTLTP
ncbi:arylamine N-acetyltransferase [Amycolatopsis sp. 195334CR]|uniref:arylamine N-acetyltransferase family protein n=1 Tax=Amycolatopsis sp. 195334CR TaxID=2814588 RepID=UPI001A90C27D|nr:arylamine N-acetyltransferase [Amycolatopsis sp. 195334CR]MBN6035031.1 arylamine N-acetyltransferase [Amycolatopsis sp. 195334CR]